MKFRKCCGRRVNLPHASTCPALRVPPFPWYRCIERVPDVPTLIWSTMTEPEES